MILVRLTTVPPEDPTTFAINYSDNKNVWETAYYDSGYQSGPYQTSADWSLSELMATLAPESGHSTTATGTTAGSTFLDAFVAIQQDYGWDGLNCYEYGTYEERATEAVDVVCAVPNNFQQNGAGTNNGGVLHFSYTWGSSDGNLSHLSQCTIGEIVTYPGSNPYVWQRPPYTRSSPNPTVIDLAATGGTFDDDHLGPPFATPFVTSSFAATQIYRFKCPCHNGGQYTNLTGTISIVRSVNQNTDGSWRYTVTKSGSTATVNPITP